MNQNSRCDTELGSAESLGWGFLKALHPEDRDRYPAQRQQAVSKGQPYEIEYRLLGADGSYHWFIEQATPVLGEDGDVQDWVVTCTPQDKGESDSQAELELVQAVNQLKDELLVREQAARDRAETLVSKVSESLKALRESEERYRSLVVATSQIVWTTNAEGQVVDMPAWRAYTGQSESEVRGWGWLDALHPEDRDRTAQVWAEAVRTKSLYDTEYRLRATDGSYRYFSVRGVPVLAEDSIREWVGICTDINDRKASEQALKARAEELTYLTTVLTQTNAALEKRNQELDQFAYVASHDLKAPLRAIANLSQWIEEDISDTLNEENRHQMNLLRGRVHRLEALIDGLLQYSRVGRVNTIAEPVDVNAVIVEVLNLLAPPPEFTVTVEPGMPTLVTQRLPLFQVFSNLISNAIKHHDRPDGQVTVSVEDQGQFYEFAVADDGPGIAPQYHEKVFGIFQTLEARDKVENTGVGLAIVKKIVEGQGGSIRLESQEGQGATFRFTWPK
jgi:PAS domain S-box-containing protein